MSAKPFTVTQRKRLCYQYGYGHRERNDWNSGDLPAPFAEGDLVYADALDGAERVKGMTPGYFVVCAGFSIDEGDAWYFRVCQTKHNSSDRLHVAYSARCTWTDDFDYMAPFTLIETSDGEGLVERQRLLAAGWAFTNNWETCPTCGNVSRADTVSVATGTPESEQQ